MQPETTPTSQRVRDWLVPILASLIVAAGTIISSQLNRPQPSPAPATPPPQIAQEKRAEPSPLPASNEWSAERWMYLINLLFSALFLLAWILGAQIKNQLPIFHRMWLFFWVGLIAYYSYKVFSSNVNLGPSFQLFLDTSLNNLNTIFVFLSYVALLYPENKDFSGRLGANRRFAAATISVFIIIFGVTWLMPSIRGVPTAKLLSGVFAGLAFCFLGARLESLLSQRYLFTIIVFLYGFVQILWVFEGIQDVFGPVFVYLSAFLCKTLVGLLVLNYYPEIATNARRFYDFKSDHIKATQSLSSEAQVAKSG